MPRKSTIRYQGLTLGEWAKVLKKNDRTVRRSIVAFNGVEEGIKALQDGRYPPDRIYPWGGQNLRLSELYKASGIRCTAETFRKRAQMYREGKITIEYLMSGEWSRLKKKKPAPIKKDEIEETSYRLRSTEPEMEIGRSYRSVMPTYKKNEDEPLGIKHLIRG